MKIEEHKSMYNWLTRPADPGEIERKNKIQNQVAGLSDELTPGPLRDELQGSFDPSQETYEEYLRRIHLGPRPFNMNQGGRVGFAIGDLVYHDLDKREVLAKATGKIKRLLKGKSSYWPFKSKSTLITQSDIEPY